MNVDDSTTLYESRVPLGAAAGAIAGAISGLLSLDANGPDAVSKPVFLDLETTGLRPDAGTLVIVAGLGFVDGGDFVVRQWFLHEPATEPAFLGAIARLIGEFDTLVTFNGKCFDVPMLINRLRLHRLSEVLPGRHLDLLYPARRIWRRRLRRSDLSTLEAHVLGTVRERDVPGYEIPGRYFAFLHERQEGAFTPVLEHNQQDVVSMARLALTIDRFVGSLDAARQAGPSDLLGLGRLLESTGRAGRAVSYYEMALIGASATERADALSRLADLARKSNELDRAIQLYAAVSDYSTNQAASAAIALAKIFEHHTRQPERALTYARRAFALMGAGPQNCPAWAMQDVLRRIARLEVKARTAPPSVEELRQLVETQVDSP
ncbi:MAG TPA: ribonuclease H-like domain-containing protein [Chloroflexota bacterium]|nr:ribonuclease H-like domain-containing protein [Chloroflexota bacterium]